MTHKQQTTKQETLAAEKRGLNALVIPSGTLKITIKGHIFQETEKAHYLQNTFWSKRLQILIEHAIVDTFATKDYKDEFHGYEGIVEAFNGFVVIKNRVYVHQPYTVDMFDEDLQVAQCMRFRNMPIREIFLFPAEISTINQPENNN